MQSKPVAPSLAPDPTLAPASAVSDRKSEPEAHNAIHAAVRHVQRPTADTKAALTEQVQQFRANALRSSQPSTRESADSATTPAPSPESSPNDSKKKKKAEGSGLEQKSDMDKYHTHWLIGGLVDKFKGLTKTLVTPKAAASDAKNSNPEAKNSNSDAKTPNPALTPPANLNPSLAIDDSESNRQALSTPTLQPSSNNDDEDEADLEQQQDYYKLLGIESDAKPREIEAAILQKHLHYERPEYRDQAMLDKLDQAEKVLLNPENRQAHDRVLQQLDSGANNSSIPSFGSK